MEAHHPQRETIGSKRDLLLGGMISRRVRTPDKKEGQAKPTEKRESVKSQKECNAQAGKFGKLTQEKKLGGRDHV